MRLDAIHLRVIRLRLREPFTISSGTTLQRRILLTRLEFDGAEGLGECVAGEAPFYSAETVDTARHVIREHLAPAVVGRSLADAAAMGRVMDRAARGHNMAKAALEMAAWDAFARAADRSLASALGGVRAAVPAGVSIGIHEDTESLMDRVATFLEQGYLRVKLKIAPGRDTAVVDAVRTRFPDAALSVDANAAYTARDLDRVRALDAYDLEYIEQPFAGDALLLHARLQDSIETPVCLDETITTPTRCRDALELGAARVVNIKPGRLAGHGPSLAVHDLCADAGVPVWCGGMLESGIGRAHNVALASLPNMRLPGDTSASGRYWERDVVDPPFTLNDDGTVTVPGGPGIGVRVDEDYLDAMTESAVTLV
ncbi:MAG: o-succinylbenzoate synthase [Longimicrobiales bacterium]|nr:o-succinylbenzoate synthase [Longimicrobiales bacterium]